MAGVLFFSLNFSRPLFALALGPWAVKPYHLLAVSLLPLFVLQGRCGFPRVPGSVAAFFLVALATSLLAGLASGLGLLPEIAAPNPLLLNYLFAGYLFLLGLSHGRYRVLPALRVAALLVALAVAVKALVYSSVLRAYLAHPLAHPEMPWFYGGGPNLEATWLAINGALLLRTRLFWPYWLFALVLAALYATRSGLAAVYLLAACGALLFSTGTIRARFGKALMAGVVAWVLVHTINPYGLIRFQEIGQEPGSLGRLALWRDGFSALAAWPFGYGAGNAILAVNAHALVPHSEDNVHNYYLQVALDFGVQGVLAWLVVLVAWLRRFPGGPLGVFAGLYFLAALVQFRGAEPLFWYVFGLYFGRGALEPAGRAAHPHLQRS